MKKLRAKFCFVEMGLAAFLMSCGQGLRNPDAVPATAAVVVASPTAEKTYQDLVFSTLMRTPGSTPLTLKGEHAQGGTLATNYREVSIAIDTEKPSEVVALGAAIFDTAAYVDCGATAVGQFTVAQSIADCATANGALATWNGATYGRMGEGQWKLVKFHNATDISVWQDQRTGLLWSDYMNDLALPAVQTFDWTTAVLGTGPCSFSDPNFSLEKAYLDSSQGVYWRLPTLSDYKQADVNGLRWVSANGLGDYFWTATISGDDITKAWAVIYQTVNANFNYEQGVSMATPEKVRCVGRVSP